MPRLVIATHNAGKMREFEAMRRLMAEEFPFFTSYELLSLTEWGRGAPEETGDTFLANALLKARAAAALTGLPALADDSGLEVAALGGAPGVYSARYAGESANDASNNAKLRMALASQPNPDRRARFVCALALARHADDPKPLLAEGYWDGEILTEPRGAGGFGYDPLFFSTAHRRGAAELSIEEKLRVSHRTVALHALLNQLRDQPL
ncbi:RdgB/HAM1 family non-canonical purine NTP pyrophosphatase [Halothiobacillus sp. DCM-1]|uniref:RdgB/HAM1 family non-canonical purine NTP pyrophosphatase n=1 Tax=Halothiobacillus sp. DCM-1 TaxID=3112558 RepID=UPI003248689E